MPSKALGTCPIQTWPGNTKHALALPGDFYEDLKLGPRDRIVIRAGSRKATAEAVFTDEPELQLTQPLREALCLPQGSLSMKAVDGELVLGPFIALYALPSKQPGKPFGELTALFRDMMRLAEEEGVSLYVFIPGEARWDQGYTSAYVYKHREGQWIRTKRPLPDIILPKILGQPPEWKERMRRDLQQIARRVPYGYFSSAVGSKWEVHRTLHARSDTREWLPETHLVQKPTDIEAMLQKHGSVYVKPSYGTQGRSIYRFDLADGGVRLQYTHQGQTQRRRIRRGTMDWQNFLTRKFCGKRSFLVQEALDLLAAQGVRPVDFRWLIQKDGSNRWHISARVARVGNRGSITTNLHTGGDAVLAEEFLSRNGYADDAARRELIGRLDEAALRIAVALEEKSGRVGEMGLDFGVTKNGGVYLIEMNPRPGRQMLKDTSPAVRELSLRRNLEYARYVTEFTRP